MISVATKKNEASTFLEFEEEIKKRKTRTVIRILANTKSLQCNPPKLNNLTKTSSMTGMVLIKSTPGICPCVNLKLKSIKGDKSYPPN